MFFFYVAFNPFQIKKKIDISKGERMFVRKNLGKTFSILVGIYVFLCSKWAYFGMCVFRWLRATRNLIFFYFVFKYSEVFFFGEFSKSVCLSVCFVNQLITVGACKGFKIFEIKKRFFVNLGKKGKNKNQREIIWRF